MALYSLSAVERSMKVQEVILRAYSGEITWIQAAHIIGVSPRTMRRWKWRYEHHGYDGLFDRRRQRPSPKRAPVDRACRYSPQARGRSERLNRTLQERVVQELRAAGIDEVEEANRYLEERYLPLHNELFAVEAKEPESLFVSCSGTALEMYLCVQEERVVGQDNVVCYRGRSLQIEKQRDRATCARLRVKVREHLDGRITVWHGQKRLGVFEAVGAEKKERKRQLRGQVA